MHTIRVLWSRTSPNFKGFVYVVATLPLWWAPFTLLMPAKEWQRRLLVEDVTHSVKSTLGYEVDERARSYGYGQVMWPMIYLANRLEQEERRAPRLLAHRDPG